MKSAIIELKTTKRFLNLGVVVFVYMKTGLRYGNRYLGVWFLGGEQMHGFWF